jgi:uncharacterized damage-inducible protein DinB
MTTTTTPTSAVTAPIATIFAINDNFVLQALKGLTHEELWKAPTDRNNAILWIAGHVVQTRAMLLNLLGEPVDTGWGKRFDRGAPAARTAEANEYPSGSEIERVMSEITPRLYTKLASLDDTCLAGPAKLQVPGTKTVGDELAFFAMHDSYHVGQLGYVRKGLGYPGLAG